MKNEHIIHLLDERFGDLTDAQQSQIQRHIVACHDCRRAHTSAQVTAMILQARATETIEPSAFFARRVMALVREQTAPSFFDLLAMWQAARSFVYSAVAVVVVGMTAPAPPSFVNDVVPMIGRAG